MTLRRSMLILVTFAMLAGCGGETGTGKNASAATNTWMSFDAGMELAMNLGKPVIIDFYTTWCRYCKLMDRETFQDRNVASYLNEHFICIRLNAEQKNTKIKYGGRTYTPAGLARAFRLQAYPSVAYLDTKGKLIFLDKGFKKPGPFMVNLKYVKSGCYEKGVSIDEFRRRGGRCE